MAEDKEKKQRDFIENERQESLWAAGWNIFESSHGSKTFWTFASFNEF